MWQVDLIKSEEKGKWRILRNSGYYCGYRLVLVGFWPRSGCNGKLSVSKTWNGGYSPGFHASQERDFKTCRSFSSCLKAQRLSSLLSLTVILRWSQAWPRWGDYCVCSLATSLLCCWHALCYYHTERHIQYPSSVFWVQEVQYFRFCDLDGKLMISNRPSQGTMLPPDCAH